MVTRKEWYQRVNAEWPAGPLPPLTFEEAVRAVRKLYRYATGHTLKPESVKRFRETSGNRRTHVTTRVINPSEGWHSLIHSTSHWLCPVGHGGKHARMEARLIREVKRRGWLSGTLKSEPKPEPVAPPKSHVVTAKLDHAQRMLMRATTRAKRATTILKKWQRKVRYYERQVQS